MRLSPILFGCAFLIPLVAGCTVKTEDQSIGSGSLLMQHEEAAANALLAATTPVEFGDGIAQSSSSTAPLLDVVETVDDTNGTVTLGNLSAPELFVYTNQASRYAEELSQVTLPRLIRDFVQTGKVRISLHTVAFQKYPNASLEAAAIYCAGKEKKGFVLFQHLAQLAVHDRAAVLKAATAQGLTKTFQECVDAADTQQKIRTHLDVSTQNGVTLVPTFDFETMLTTGLPPYPDLRGWLEELIKA